MYEGLITTNDLTQVVSKIQELRVADKNEPDVISITYSNLKSKRDTHNLIPGKVYRITDYVTTTTNVESRSAGHQFDILVTAKDNSNLLEDAQACLHSGDTYFSNVNFNGWKIWYCLDNDTNRFNWADTINGKGVIYRLIDEWNNDLPYDFKNIQFKRYKVTAKSEYNILSRLNNTYIGLANSKSKGFDTDLLDFKWYYTFSILGSTWNDEISDGSVFSQGIINNSIEVWKFGNGGPKTLNNIVIADGDVLDSYFTPSFLNSVEGYTYPSDVTSMHSDLGCANAHFGQTANNLSLFGGTVHIYAQSQFRYNIIFAPHRHCDYKTDWQNNTIYSTLDYAFNTFNGYTEDNVVVTDGFCSNIFGDSFRYNTINGFAISNSEFSSYTHYNSFGTFASPAVILYSNFGERFANNILTGYITQLYTNSQITNCQLNGIIVDCKITGIVQYIIIPSGTANSQFIGVEIKGIIRGTGNNEITINNSNFRRGSTMGVVCRKITIEGDTSGKIIASWWDNEVPKTLSFDPTTSEWTDITQNKIISALGYTPENASSTTIVTTQPASFLPNTVYDLGTITGTVTFALATPTDNTIANPYYWTFETSSTAPNITWPANIVWSGGSAPTINTSKHYEIYIRNNYARYLEF